jgi:hypothetical protein
MDERTCVCGFVATADYHLIDHLGEVFIPADSRAADGQLHAEAARDVPRVAGEGLTCLCGYRVRDGVALDAHLLEVFTSHGHVGLDGQPHAPWPVDSECPTVPSW